MGISMHISFFLREKGDVTLKNKSTKSPHFIGKIFIYSPMDAPMARRLGHWMEKTTDPRKESDWVSLTDSALVQPLVALMACCSAGRIASRSVPPTARSKVQGSVQRRDYQRAILRAPGLVHPKDAS